MSEISERGRINELIIKQIIVIINEGRKIQEELIDE